MDTVGKKRVGQIERIAWKHITVRKIDGKWEFAVWHSELSPVFCDNLKGWDSDEDGAVRREGTYVYLWAETNTIL